MGTVGDKDSVDKHTSNIIKCPNCGFEHTLFILDKVSRFLDANKKVMTQHWSFEWERQRAIKKD